MIRPRSNAGGIIRRGAFVLGVTLALLLLCLGCSDEPETTLGPSFQVVSAQEGPPSIVLIVVESLRAGALASDGSDRSNPLPLDGRSVTPTMDSLAARGTRYAWTTSASPSTAPI